MDKHVEESTKQSIQKDDTEETSPLPETVAPGPFTEDPDHEDRSTQVTKDETHEIQLSKDEENSHSQSVIKLETKTSIDNASSKMCSTKSLNPQMESGSSAEVIDVPTRQVSETSISTSNTISTSLFKRSEPIAIPSTSRDSSGLAPEESFPKRPTNFGPNVKQAVHVFHPRNPTSVLHRFPVPYHSGRWAYLRDSPESSDYGGSPDSLDDPFLMEVLDIDTPENEMVDCDTPHFEERPLCSPSLLIPVGIDSLSESGEVGGAIGDEPPQSGHIKKTIEDIPSESVHIEATIEDISSELGHIKATIDDLPSELGHIEATIDDLPSDSGHIIRTIGGLPDESAIIERSLLNSPSERRRRVIIGIDTSDRSIVEQQYESAHSGLLQGTDVGTLPHESGYSEKCMEDIDSDSAQGERPIEDLPSQSSHIDEGNGVVVSKSDHI